MSFAVRPGVVAVAIVVGLTACGSSHTATPPKSQGVEQVLRSYLSAQGAGDGQTACSLLTDAAQHQLETLVVQAAKGFLPGSPSCPDAVGLVHAVAGAGLLDALSKARISQVQVHGDTATAEISDGGAFAPQQVTLQQSGGSWKIAGVPGLGG